MLPGERDGTAASRQPHALGYLGNDANLEVLVLVMRNEHHALVIAYVYRHRDPHTGEHDGVFHWDQSQRGHGKNSISTYEA
jgi:hypothetical protein